MSLKYITMPKWGIEMQKGILSEWHVQEGEEIEKGQLIALVETDKITNEMEADTPGVMHKIFAEEGEERVVGQLLAVMGAADASEQEIAEFVAAFKAADTSMAGSEAIGEGSSKEELKETSKPEPVDESVFDGLRISPAAKRLAINLGVNPALITASGRSGRISLQDVEQAAIEAGLMNTEEPEVNTAPANTPVIEEMSNLRKTAAKRLAEAKSTIPHFYLRINVTLDALLAQKEDLKKAGQKTSLNDFLIKAVSLALIENLDVNVQLHGNNIHKFPHADIAVAIATDHGLVTPVVTSADTRNLTDISATVRDFAERARNKKLTHADMVPGTFTLSNLGMFGVDQFDAIINPPQCAILAVGGSRRVWVENDDAGSFMTQLSLSLSCDHRAIDGATGASFLKTLKHQIENPKDWV